MRKLKVTRISLALLSLILFLPGAGGILAAQPLTKVTVHLDWLVTGSHTAYFVAIEKGFYKEVGLEVKLEPGKGSAEAVRIVGAGRAPFGLADAGTVSKGVAKGAPVTVVAIIFQHTPMVVVSLKGSGIKEPKDLEGHSIGMAPWESTRFVFPVFAKKNGVDVNKVKLVSAGFAAKIPSLLTKKVDALGGYIQEFVGVKGLAEKELNIMRFPDYGVELYSNGIIVNNSFMKEHPDLVRAFVRASMRGWEYTLANLDEAISILNKNLEKPKSRESLHAFFKVLTPLIKTADTLRWGYGWMDDKKWESTQRIMVEYGGQKGMVSPGSLYTIKFLK